MCDLGLQLKELRSQRCLTQKALAKRIHKSIPSVSRYEQNVQLPQLDVLISIASALNVTLDYLENFEQESVYSTANLNETQKELVALLFTEFTKPTRCSTSLSP